MSSNYRGNSLFDDIFQLQSTIPDNDIDPEDPEDGFKSGLTEGATEEVEELGSTQLKKRTAVILDDPRYLGKRTARKDLYSDDEDDELRPEDGDISSMVFEYASNEEGDDDSDDADEGDDEDGSDESVEEDEDENDEPAPKVRKDAVVRAPSESSDRGKGKAVAHQLGLWDDLMRCRISLQKMLSACNRLPLPDDWDKFASVPEFEAGLQSAQGSMGKVLASLMDLQEQMNSKVPDEVEKGKLQGSDDEEITSESDPEDEDDANKKAPKSGADNVGDDDDDSEEEEEEDVDNDEMDVENGKGRQEDDMDFDDGAEDENSKQEKQKQFEDLLTAGHKKFSTYRNNTLLKWDEKTRLTSAYVKSKNFAAFDISVLKQIQQVLANKMRLIRRIHQNRSNIRILGQASSGDQTVQELVLEDDEDEVEVRGRPKRPEMDVNFEIVDDSDFYQMCLKDFIQLKQSDEDTNPDLLNKHMIEIQNLRKKQKRKVDTRATKGKKIRYHVKEQLRNFMAPYDKSTWTDQQKDDLFKALFGGQQSQNTETNVVSKKEKAPTINIGL